MLIALHRVSVVLILAALAALAACAAPQTKAQAQFLTYANIEQGYREIVSLYDRGRLTKQKAAQLTLGIDLAMGLQDLVRDPHSPKVQDALARALAVAETLKAVTPQQSAAIKAALAKAGGGGLPSGDDYAGWLMLGSQILDAVSASLSQEG